MCEIVETIKVKSWRLSLSKLEVPHYLCYEWRWNICDCLKSWDSRVCSGWVVCCWGGYGSVGWVWFMGSIWF